MYYERRRVEACVDESAHHALCVFIITAEIRDCVCLLHPLQSCSLGFVDLLSEFWKLFESR